MHSVSWFSGPADESDEPDEYQFQTAAGISMLPIRRAAFRRAFLVLPVQRRSTFLRRASYCWHRANLCLQVLAQGCGPSSFTLSSGSASAGTSVRFCGFCPGRLAGPAESDGELRICYETQNNIKDHLDFAPRFGFAWAPGVKGNKPSKTVVRGGL